MLNKTILISLLAIEFVIGDIEISGVVKDSKNGKPIGLVNIWDSASGTGTSTDNSGLFKISSQSQKHMDLSFSHIAYDNYHQKFYHSDTTFVLLMTETLLHMNDVVVTSTRSGYLLRDVPIATEIIGTKEINESGAVTISDLLLQKAGVSASFNVDGSPIINMLGLDSKHILVLKDGRPITGRFNNRVDLSQISVNRTKKIEITKGPCSAIYGSDAMGAVVNIITDDIGIDPKINISYRASSNNDDVVKTFRDGFSSIIKGDVIYPLNNLKILSDIAIQKFNNGSQFEYINADKISKTNLNTDLIWAARDHELKLNHQYYDQYNDGASRLSNGTVLNTITTGIGRQEATFSHFWKLNKNITIDQSLRKSDYKRKYRVVDNGGTTETDNTTEENDIEYEILFSGDYPKIKVNAGLEISRPQYASERIKSGQQNKNINGVFNQVSFNMSSSTTIVTGIRYDSYDELKIFSPRIAIAYKKNEKLIFRSSYGHGFRIPSFTERLIDWENTQVGYSIIGNPDLEPEVSKGVTVGVEYINQKNLQLSTMLYHNNFSNLIKSSNLEPGVFSYENIENANFTGAEIIAKWAISNSLSSSITMNYTKAADGSGNPVPDTMPFSFGGRISFAPNNKKILMSMNFKGIGEYKPQEFDPVSGENRPSPISVKPYMMGDMQLSYNLTNISKIILGFTNITNHTNMSFGPYLGRSGYIEIRSSMERK
tara:strand:- start:387 stop:2525 length:2139 start_codon:yes stop_codon:yes gene_type:complete